MRSGNGAGNAGFAAVMEGKASNRVHVIIVETATRFSRDLIVQETGVAMLDQLSAALTCLPSYEVRQVCGIEIRLLANNMLE